MLSIEMIHYRRGSLQCVSWQEKLGLLRNKGEKGAIFLNIVGLCRLVGKDKK